MPASDAQETAQAKPAFDWQWRTLPTDTEEDLAKCAEMLQAARDFVTDIRLGHPPRWLVLLGTPGCGKTHLARRIGDWLRRYGRWCYDKHVYPRLAEQQDARHIYTYVQEGREFAKWDTILNGSRDGKWWDFSRACSDHYKVIDDLGVDSFTRDFGGVLRGLPFPTQKMGELLDRRLEKWTVITANFTIEDFSDAFDSRIASRLLRNSVVVSAFGVRDFKLEERRDGRDRFHQSR
jgi:hypothetical protein